MGYNFKRRDEIVDALRLIKRERASRTATNTGPADVHRISEGFVLKTPASGIPAMTNDTPGKVKCVPMYINSQDKLVEFPNVEYYVYNVFPADIGGGTIITAKRLYGKLVADAEACPP